MRTSDIGLPAGVLTGGAEVPVRSSSKAVLPSDVQLHEMAEGCLSYVALMEDTMPHECNLVKHFGWIQANLFSLS